MRNLLSETLDIMSKLNLTAYDIDYVGSANGKVDIGGWEGFERLADFYYDNGYGTAEVVSDLVLVFRNGVVLFRSERDGSEWWDWLTTHREPDCVILNDANLYVRNYRCFDTLDGQLTKRVGDDHA